MTFDSRGKVARFDTFDMRLLLFGILLLPLALCLHSLRVCFALLSLRASLVYHKVFAARYIVI